VASTTAPATNNAFMDLAPGGFLRILVPVLTSQGSRVETSSPKAEGNTVVLSAANLAGYEVSYYSITGRANGKVRLKFVSAEITKEGKTEQEARAPSLPFSLPSKAQHIRLIYLVRNSQSDHNMAITASKALDELNDFTNRLKGDPDLCKTDGEVFCSWVPAGVAVRPEAVARISHQPG